LSEALESYRASLAIGERLAKQDPGNAVWQRDLVVSYYKLADLAEKQGAKPAALDNYRKAQAIVSAMSDRGILAPSDTWMIEDLEKRVKRNE